MSIDPAYRAVARDDFPAMITPDRYGQRSSDFDEIIARTEEHFWNPADPDYIDYAAPCGSETIVPAWFVLESNTAVWDRLDEGQRIRLVNESARWSISNILHGEQGALSLSASLCDMADLTELEVDLSIPERDVDRLIKFRVEHAKPQKCQVRADAFPGRVYDGYVSRIMPTADRAKGAIPVRVKVKVPRDEEGVYLKPEMGVIVSFKKS